MFFADYHVHTNFSFDSDTLAEPEKCVERAIELGMDEIAVTDHLDFKYCTLEAFPYIDLKRYAVEIPRIKEKYKKEINVVFGLELGPHIGNVHLVDSLTVQYPFDFIICSTHDIKGLGIWDDNAFFIGKTKRESHEEYLNEVLAVIKAAPNYNVYGHIDYLDRYGLYEDKNLYYSEHAEIVDEIFKSLISAGKGIEINTSGYRYGLPYATPKLEFLRRYRELGGEIITIGSDAHSIETIGYKFGEARETLLSAGFKYITSFSGLKPTMRPI